MSSQTKGTDRAAAVGVLRHQRVHRRVGDEQARDPPPLRQRHRRPHVGHRLPAPRGHLAQHGRRGSPPTSGRSRSRRPGCCSGSTPCAATTSTSTASRRSPPTSGRRPTQLNQDLDRRTPPDADPRGPLLVRRLRHRVEGLRVAVRRRRPRRCELDGAVAVVTGGAGRHRAGHRRRAAAAGRHGGDRRRRGRRRSSPPSTTCGRSGRCRATGSTSPTSTRSPTSPTRSTTPTARSTCCSTTPASPRAAAASRGSRSRTTGAGASASTCSARRSAPRRSCPG